MLQFNIPLLISDLKKIIGQKLDGVAKLAKEFMIGEIGLLPERGSIKSVGKPDWRRDVLDAINFVKADVGNEVIREVGIINQEDSNLMFKALLVEFGMGSEANWQVNPYIQEYLASEYYDSKRGGKEVFSRPREYVYNPDSGEFELSEAKTRHEIPYFRQQGSFYFVNAMRLIQSDFWKVIDEVSSELDFSKYLIVK